MKNKKQQKKQQNNTETKPQILIFFKEISFYSNFWIKSGKKIHKGFDLGKNVSTNSSPSTGANSNRLEKIKNNTNIFSQNAFNNCKRKMAILRCFKIQTWFNIWMIKMEELK